MDILDVITFFLIFMFINILLGGVSLLTNIIVSFELTLLVLFLIRLTIIKKMEVI